MAPAAAVAHPPSTHPLALWSVAAFTVAALIAFASNSLLCRLALRTGSIDPAGFTLVRLVSGAVVLATLSRVSAGRGALHSGSWASAAALFAYAIAFSFAYISLDAGVGALLLFGSVQATMLVVAIRAGDRPTPAEWIGLGLAIVGLVTLTAPGLTAPPPLSAGLMIAAGVAWGVYTLRGKKTSNPLVTTSANFVRSVPMVAAAWLLVLFWREPSFTPTGVGLAVASGGLASGIGYAIWYRALPSLTSTRAAVVQLAVPVIAAAGGVMLLGERLTLRLIGAAALILGGIALAVLRRAKAK